MKESKDENIVARDFVDMIKTVIAQEINKLDTTIVCKVVEENDNGTFNVYVEPDVDNVIKGIKNITNYVIKAGDYVYVYKVRNQLNNAFIINKIGLEGQNIFKILEDIYSRLERLEQANK